MEKTFKKRQKIIFLVLLMAAMAGSFTGCNQGNSMREDAEYKWPDSILGSRLPKPDSKYGEISYESESKFHINIYDMSKEQFKAYVDECKNMGFVLGATRFDGYYSANDENGFSLNINYNEEEKILRILLRAPRRAKIVKNQ